MAEKTQVAFKKEDFLGVRELTKRLGGVEFGKVKSVMAAEFKRGTKFIQGGYKRDLIIKPKSSHHADTYKLHPLGFEKFKEILEKAK